MLLGISKFHQPQRLPSDFTNNSNSYPNDLSAKVHWFGFPDRSGVPLNKLSNGEYMYFPISLAQKAIASYESGDLKVFFLIADWFKLNVDDNGGYDCWSKSGKNTTSNYSSMAQGQVLSVLTRAYKATLDKDYLFIADKVYDCLMNEKNNLALEYKKGAIAFDETPQKKTNVILNGWIFTLWGIKDYEAAKNLDADSRSFQKLSNDLANNLNIYDNGYWSLYSENDYICSPFYHDLHIEQLKAMYILTDIKEFDIFAKRFEVYKSDRVNCCRAFIKKAYQKITEKQFNEFIG